MSFPDSCCRKVLLVSASLILATAASSFAGQEQEAFDPAKRSSDRAELFLLRTYDELNKYLEYERSAIEGLEKRSPGLPESGATGGQLLDWHRKTAGWLIERLRETESDLENFYSGTAPKTVIDNRYTYLSSGYARLGEQLDRLAAGLDEAKRKNAAELRKRGNIIEYYEYMNEEVEKRKVSLEQRRPVRLPPDDWLLYYKDMDRETVNKIRTEISALEELQKGIGLLRELELDELNWVRIKAADSKALDALGNALLSGSLDTIERKTYALIRQYEADISLIQKLLRELEEKRPRMGNSDPGSISALDREIAFSDYSFIMKTRWEHHLQWLREMIGGYRADIVLLEKERKR